MNRIEEINERLAAIETEIANATGDALRALEEEVDELIDERTHARGRSPASPADALSHRCPA